LMGVENEKPETGENAFRLNFTNEGGYRYRYRFLKNIMGLWMIQSVKNEAEAKGEKISFGELSERASKETIPTIIPCNDDRFLSPASMTEEVRNCCREQNDPVPETLSEIAAVIYNSLAVCYKDTVAEIESVTGEHYDTIYIVGGGSDAVFLNEQTKRATARKIVAGPKEATAIGNALVQMLADGTFSSLEEGREAIRRSFPIREY
ncbi:MAG: rhamnulokinase, partial [Lachnospiraceae bacterium]|nr:rhamnulokinase [Lachnospiraceae bacterium]